jgi:hypothetical protein
VTASAATTTPTTGRRRATVVMICFGTLLVLFTMMILSFFNTSGTARSAEVANPRSRAVALAPAVADQALVVQPAQQAQSLEDQLRAAVERANRAFIEARAQANIAPLQPVAVGEWLAQEQSALADLRARGQTENWRLVRLEYLQVEPRGQNEGFVCTREVWEVTTIGPGGVVGPTRSYTYQEGYYLSRPAGTWVVTRIEIG